MLNLNTAIRKSIKSENEGNEFKDERSIALSEWDPCTKPTGLTPNGCSA